MRVEPSWQSETPVRPHPHEHFALGVKFHILLEGYVQLGALSQRPSLNCGTPLIICDRLSVLEGQRLCFATWLCNYQCFIILMAYAVISVTIIFPSVSCQCSKEQAGSSNWNVIFLITILHGNLSRELSVFIQCDKCASDFFRFSVFYTNIFFLQLAWNLTRPAFISQRSPKYWD